MRTSYFAKYKEQNGVSISGKSPDWFVGREYKKLAPKFWFFQKYKKDGDTDFYIEQYQKEILDRLDPKQVFADLGSDAVLLCWEKSGEFCHRRLVAAWLEEHLGIAVPEVLSHK